jgi:hypothetical protein
MPFESYACIGQPIDLWTGRTRIPITSETFGSKSVDDHEEHVHVVPISQCGNILDGPARALVPAAERTNLDEGREEDERNDSCDYEPRPTLINELLLHARQASAARLDLILSTGLYSQI